MSDLVLPAHTDFGAAVQDPSFITAEKCGSNQRLANNRITQKGRLCAAFLGGALREYYRAETLDLGAENYYSSFYHGCAIGSDDTADSRIYTGYIPATASPDQCTFVVRARTRAVADIGMILGFGGAAPKGYVINLTQTSIEFTHNGSTVISATFPSETGAHGSCFCIRIDLAGNSSIHMDGRPLSSSSSVVSENTANPTGSVYLMRGYKGEMDFAAIVDDFLTDDQAAILSIRPELLFFESVNDAPYLYAISGGGVSLLAGPDTLAPEAPAANIGQTHATAGAIATLTPEAPAASLSTAIALAAAVADITPEALTAALSQTHGLAIDPADLTPEALAAAVAQSHALGVAADALTPEAVVAALSQTHSLGAGVDTLTPATPAVSLAAAIVLAAAAADATPETLAAAIAQAHALGQVADEITAEAVAAAVAQTHGLAAGADALTPEAPAASMLAAVVLAGAPADATPETVGGAIGQAHALAVAVDALTPEAVAAAIAQTHGLTVDPDDLTPEAVSASLVGEAIGLGRPLYLFTFKSARRLLRVLH